MARIGKTLRPGEGGAPGAQPGQGGGARPGKGCFLQLSHEANNRG